MWIIPMKNTREFIGNRIFLVKRVEHDAKQMLDTFQNKYLYLY